MSISRRVRELLCGHDLHRKFEKKHNSITMLMELFILIFAYSLMMRYIGTKVRGNISKGFRVIEQTQFPW